MPVSRYVLSRVLNRVFSRGLSLRVRDMSSGFRLYHAPVVRDIPFIARDFDVVQEVLVRAYVEGWRVAEVPFHYEPRRHGSSHARVLKFGAAYLRTFRALWTLRNALDCADYDARAFDSAIPLQRYWQRRRHRLVTGLVADQGRAVDVGCGSSRIIASLPGGSVAVDIRRPQLRYARRYGRAVVQASGCDLPFADGTFDCVVCSQALEQVPEDAGMLDELGRVLRPGGRLVLGTIDQARWEWRVIEPLYRKIVSGASRGPRARYTAAGLIAGLGARGYAHEATRRILGAEVILAFRKPA
jgi:SAM-dependent methyltransferase